MKIGSRKFGINKNRGSDAPPNNYALRRGLVS